ncbi:MAG: hypothetical protein QMD06_04225, partial [Candidatus Altarchaeum sp.]|nr:hypothetical protein [Candidatus Altarchaeum sp.]
MFGTFCKYTNKVSVSEVTFPVENVLSDSFAQSEYYFFTLLFNADAYLPAFTIKSFTVSFVG